MTLRAFRAVSLALGWAVSIGGGVGTPALAGEHCKHHETMRAEMEARGIQRAVAAYVAPAETLLDQDGKEVELVALLGGAEPIALNFIFTSCTTICPVLSATFAHLDSAAPEEARRVRRVSISIDPEVDRPNVLKAYAASHKAGERWIFLTGRPDQIVRILQAFDAYTGSKMSHRPVTFLRGQGAATWTRYDGFLKGSELAFEVRGLAASTH